MPIPTQDELAGLKLAGSGYGLDEKLLPQPAISLPAIPGTAVVFPSMKSHSVSEVLRRRRTTESGLIAFRGMNMPVGFYR